MIDVPYKHPPPYSPLWDDDFRDKNDCASEILKLFFLKLSPYEISSKSVQRFKHEEVTDRQSSFPIYNISMDRRMDVEIHELYLQTEKRSSK